MTDALPQYRYLDLAQESFTLFLTLNRPEVRNAINAGMWDEIEDVFTRTRDMRTIRAIVLRGAGGVFCAGGDILERTQLSNAADGPEKVAERNARAGRIFSLIDTAPQAVIAVVEKYAYGGGFGLACVSDVTIAAPDAVFRLPEVTLGLAPAQIVPFLLRRIGPGELRRFAVTAAPIDAHEAYRIGLVHYLCRDTLSVDEALARTLSHLSKAEPHAIAAAKALIAEADRADQQAFFELAARKIAELAASPTGGEGAAAFSQKRAPHWRS